MASPVESELEGEIQSDPSASSPENSSSQGAAEEPSEEAATAPLGSEAAEADATLVAAGGEPADEESSEPSAGARAEELGPGEELDDDELARQTLALLFASPEALSSGRIKKLLERPSNARVKIILERLQGELDASFLPVVLREIASGWRLLTDPELGDVVARLRKDPRPDRITAAVLETLSIVAYRQPVTKAEVEAIRGVQAGPILRTLVDRGLVRVTGRASLPGSPLQYGTTKEFLERFGLASLKDLPRDGELTES